MQRSKMAAMAAMAVLICALAWDAAMANDRSVVGQGGTVVPMQGEHKTVRMVRETVTVDVYPRFYQVVARFWFRNEGPATTVKMGFPETGTGDIDAAKYKSRAGFLSFSSTVDGQPAKVRRVLAGADVGEQHYEAHWVKDVRFGAGRSRTVEVRYRAPLSTIAENCDMEDGRGCLVTYQFSGENWKGRVDESRLEMTFHLPSYKVMQGYLPPGTVHKGDRYAWVARNWEAKGRFSAIFCQGKGRPRP